MAVIYQNRIINRSIYALIGINAGFGLFLVYYWLLLQNSTLTAFYYNTRMDTVYMWTYISTIIATVILFGLNASLAVYLYRRTKILTMKLGRGGRGVQGGNSATPERSAGAPHQSKLGAG